MLLLRRQTIEAGLIVERALLILRRQVLMLAIPLGQMLRVGLLRVASAEALAATIVIVPAGARLHPSPGATLILSRALVLPRALLLRRCKTVYCEK